MTRDNIRILEEIKGLSDSDWKELKEKLLNDIVEGERQLKENVETEEKISKLLKELGVPAHILGYKYLKKAIMLGLDNSDILLMSICKELYPAIAKEYGSSPLRVERAIRVAIETAWDRGNWEKIEKIFGYSCSPQRGRATNKEFIATLVEYLSN